ncbi:unnamed protein product [Paramecium octaurelia]|uniref:C2 domain-containing protein n=1 Tax=Paramecium octaurelia TaxID=43137 RepID=A0A8S1TAR3_PAROT|nr:unnamed protein product [Paramecium octaurelia]
MDQDEIIKQVVHVFNKLSTNQQQPISKETLLKFLDTQSNQEYDRGLFEQMYEKIVQKDSGQLTVQKFIRTLMEALKSLKNKISTIQTQISQKKKNLEDHKSTLHQLQSQEQFNQYKISRDSRIRVTIHDADIQFPGNSPIAVILGCENIRYSTKAARRENLVWEEKFEFDIQTGKEEIYIVILDKELADREEIGGQTKLNLKDFYDQKSHEITLELKDKYNVVRYSTIRARVQWIHSQTKYCKEVTQELQQNIKSLEDDVKEYKNYIHMLFLPFEENYSKSQGDHQELSDYSTNQHTPQNQLEHNPESQQWLKYGFILTLIYSFLVLFSSLFKTEFLDSIVIFQSLIYYLDNDKFSLQLHIKVITLMLAFSLIIDVFWLIIYTTPWTSNDVLFFQIEHGFQVYEVIMQYILFGIKITLIFIYGYIYYSESIIQNDPPQYSESQRQNKKLVDNSLQGDNENYQIQQ